MQFSKYYNMPISKNFNYSLNKCILCNNTFSLHCSYQRMISKPDNNDTIRLLNFIKLSEANLDLSVLLWLFYRETETGLRNSDVIQGGSTVPFQTSSWVTVFQPTWPPTTTLIHNDGKCFRVAELDTTAVIHQYGKCQWQIFEDTTLFCLDK